MKIGTFVKGVGVGMAAGVCVGMMSAPKNRRHTARCTAGKTIKSIGDMIENLF